MSKIKVTGLKLETENGKKIKLTLAEAKELYDQLEDLFGVEVEVEHHYHDHPYVWKQPYIWYNSTNSPWSTLTTTATNIMAVSGTTNMKMEYLTE